MSASVLTNRTTIGVVVILDVNGGTRKKREREREGEIERRRHLTLALEFLRALQHHSTTRISIFPSERRLCRTGVVELSANGTNPRTAARSWD